MQGLTVVALRPATSQEIKNAYNKVYAIRNGRKENIGASAFKPGHGTIARKYGHAPDPEQLSHEEIHQTYKSVLDAALLSARKGKKKRAIQLLGELGDKKITAAVTDTLFRNGSGEGAFLIQRAINATRSPRNRIAEYGGFGSKTYDALKEVAQNPRKHRIFLDTLSDGRMAAKSYDPAEKERVLFYRFPGWKPEEEKQ